MYEYILLTEAESSTLTRHLTPNSTHVQLEDTTSAQTYIQASTPTSDPDQCIFVYYYKMDLFGIRPETNVKLRGGAPPHTPTGGIPKKSRGDASVNSDHIMEFRPQRVPPMSPVSGFSAGFRSKGLSLL